MRWLYNLNKKVHTWFDSKVQRPWKNIIFIIVMVGSVLLSNLVSIWFFWLLIILIISRMVYHQVHLDDE